MPSLGNANEGAALRAVMDITAITELKSRATDAIASAEKYRALAERKPRLGSFYHALAFTHERMAREAILMIDRVEELTSISSGAA